MFTNGLLSAVLVGTHWLWDIAILTANWVAWNGRRIGPLVIFPRALEAPAPVKVLARSEI
jgi:hypothetical protein